MKLNGYDYRDRKRKVEEILDKTDEVKEVNKFPRDEDFTYTNGYKAWTGAIFIDLRDSTSLFTDKNDVDIAKVIRGFTSEIIEILRKDTEENLKEIGIRGDCVYAIYSAPLKSDIYDICNRAVYINTYMLMLNELLSERDLPNIRAGIGLDVSKTLAVKAGRKSSGINNLVWIGQSVAKASKLSDLGNKNSINPIVMSSDFYTNYMDVEDEMNKNNTRQLWSEVYSPSLGTYYHGNVVYLQFEKWIREGMKL
ncbi:adenylate/guanylate cyclase domain-containing protein [Bacillus subtilis]|uniref:adenylate/guanylate cyclase domain-containing protein n=1 Tax=Bacillus subtilis TaxID=1423 RepID=UPI002E2315C5|nr:adenylate/guanylate cyclase domain-containing protein [Bacillus subtilis]